MISLIFTKRKKRPWLLLVWVFYLAAPCIGQEKLLNPLEDDITPNFSCPPKLKIKYLKTLETPGTSESPAIYKNWQAVAGKDFIYRGDPGYGNDYSWSLGNYSPASNTYNSFWNFDPVPNERKGSAAIDGNNLPSSNSDFGDAHGDTRFTATLGDNTATVYSDEEQKVRVYFDKDAEVHFHDGQLVPNWFHYWGQIDHITARLTIPGIRLFNVETCMFDPTPSVPSSVTLTMVYRGDEFPYEEAGSSYGSSLFNSRNWEKYDPYGDPCNLQDPIPRSVATGYIDNNKDSRVIKIGEGCGFRKRDPADPNNEIEGIHVLYSTVVHEAEHAIIQSENWTEGYDSSLDTDMDGYNDSWEFETNLNLPAGACFFFTIGINDAYNDNYVAEELGTCPFFHTMGTEYEEWRCRDKEASLDLNIVNNLDWSYDSKKKNQGKQW